MYSIDYINLICTDLEITDTHEYEIDGINAICVALGGTAHKYNIDALNDICTLMGYTGGCKYNIQALNTIVVGGTYEYENQAWKDIQQGAKVSSFSLKDSEGFTLVDSEGFYLKVKS